MDAVAIVSIVAAAVLSLTVAVVTVTADNRRQRHRSQLERLNELRDVLDRGGGALTSALFAFDRRRVSRTPSESAETGPEFNRKVEQVEALEARIAIRLGEEEPAALSFEDARRCLQDLRGLVYEAGENWAQEQDDRADELRAQVVTTRREYLEHARKRVNPEA